jgi:hypothetical protein
MIGRNYAKFRQQTNNDAKLTQLSDAKPLNGNTYYPNKNNTLGLKRAILGEYYSILRTMLITNVNTAAPAAAVNN